MATASDMTGPEPLHCLLCNNEYQVPRSLPCRHTYCEKCLKSYIESVGLQESDTGKHFDCPACRSSVMVPDAKACDITKDFPLNALYKSLSPTKSSDPTNCDVCQSDKVIKSAIVWCNECCEALCDECCDAHKKVRLTKKHQTIDLSKQVLAYTRSNEECPKHPGTMLELFCLYHKELCCALCAPTLHNGCKPIMSLDDIAKRVEKHKEKTSYVSEFDDMKKEIKSVFEQEDLHIGKVDKDYRDMLSQMDTLITAAKTKLDELHGSFKANANAQWNTRKEILSRIQKETRMLQINTENCVISMSAVTERASPRQMFVIQEQMKTQLTAHVNNVRPTINDYRETQLKLETEDAVSKIVKSILSVGHIIEGESPSVLVETAMARIDENIDILRQKPEISLLEASVRTSDMLGSLVITRPVGAADLMTCTTRKVKSVTNPEFGRKTRFSGGTYLPNGCLLLADQGNNLVVEFDDNYNVVHKNDSTSCPIDITYSDKHKKVLVRTKTEIKPYKINDDHQKTISLKYLPSQSSVWCHNGITVHNDTLIVGTDTFVVMLAMDGTEQKSFPRTGRCSYVAVCSELERFCYPDGNVVVCCRMDGPEIFRYQDGNLGGITGVSFDKSGNIYVCCTHPTGKVFQISHDGQRGRNLSLDQSDIKCPLYVMYHPSEEQFLVTSLSVDKNVLFEVFEMVNFTK